MAQNMILVTITSVYEKNILLVVQVQMSVAQLLYLFPDVLSAHAVNC